MTGRKLEIAAGIIVEGGKCLITRRSAGVHLGGLWEFPGGKFLPGESAEDCLHREVYEETGLKINIERPLLVVDHSYPGRDVRLRFFLCRPLHKTPNKGTAEQSEWVPFKDLDRYRFPEANAPVLLLIKKL